MGGLCLAGDPPPQAPQARRGKQRAAYAYPKTHPQWITHGTSNLLSQFPLVSTHGRARSAGSGEHLRCSAAPRRGEPRPALIRRSECLGGLAMPRTSSSAKPWPKPSPGASDRPTPARFQPRAAAERLFRRVPPPPPRSLCLSRTIHHGRTRLDRVPVRSNSPDLDPTDQIRRYRFAVVILLKSP